MSLPPATALAGPAGARRSAGAARSAGDAVSAGARRAGSAGESVGGPVPFMVGLTLQLRRPAGPRLPAGCPERVERDGADVVPAHRLAAEDRAVDARAHHP